MASRTAWERVRVLPLPLSVSRWAMQVLKLLRNSGKRSERAVVGDQVSSINDTAVPSPNSRCPQFSPSDRIDVFELFCLSEYCSLPKTTFFRLGHPPINIAHPPHFCGPYPTKDFHSISSSSAPVQNVVLPIDSTLTKDGMTSLLAFLRLIVLVLLLTACICRRLGKEISPSPSQTISTPLSKSSKYGNTTLFVFAGMPVLVVAFTHPNSNLSKFGRLVRAFVIVHPLLLSCSSVMLSAKPEQSSCARLKPSGREATVPSVKVRVKPSSMWRLVKAATAVGMSALAGGMPSASLPSTRPRINRRMRSANDIGVVPSPSAVRGVVQWRRRILRHKGTNSSTSLWGVVASGGMAQPVQSCSKRLNAAEAVASASLTSKRLKSAAAYSGCMDSMCFISFGLRSKEPRAKTNQSLFLIPCSWFIRARCCRHRRLLRLRACCLGLTPRLRVQPMRVSHP